MSFDTVVANPPYMGAKGMNEFLKLFAKDVFPASKADLFSMFIERAFVNCKPIGLNSMVTMQSWMFLSSFEEFRDKIILSHAIDSVAHLGGRAFSELQGPTVQVVAFVLVPPKIDIKPIFKKLDAGDESWKIENWSRPWLNYSSYSMSDFCRIPGSRFAYWINSSQIKTFESKVYLEDVLTPRQGMATSDNGRFVRYWWEVSSSNVCRSAENNLQARESGKKWFPYNKGGAPIRWYGNQDFVVNWESDGAELLAFASSLYGSPTRTIKNISHYFRRGITWSDITFKNRDGEESFAARLSPGGYIFDVKGSSGFPDSGKVMALLCLLNSKVLRSYMSILNPTATFQVGDIKSIPYMLNYEEEVKLLNLGEKAVCLAKRDYVENETSPEFLFLECGIESHSIQNLFDRYELLKQSRVEELLSVESDINSIISGAYGLIDVVDSSVRRDEITLKSVSKESFTLFLVSYIVGSVLGRYSLDESGLVYTGENNLDFDESRYKTFPADADGIVPITDELWFEDDAANRIREYVRVVWGADTLEENMAWLAESLGKKDSETPDETVRRYLSDKFFKDHLQTYKKRPIYWLFSSGKQGAFQTLVYLHRYHEGTLARMRAEYVVPLTGKIQSRIEILEKDAESASSTAARNKINKEIEKLRKKHVELLAYDEKLRHYADMRIKLDLDDGVKVNYGKFGDLLDSVKAITGGSDD